MIILQMCGGLGNQLFHYAMYQKLKSLGKEVKFDDNTSYALDNARPIQLAVFGLDYPRATAEEIIAMRDSSPALKDKIRRKLHGRQLKQYMEKDYSFDPHIFELDDTYLVGYFQSERYFSDIKEVLREQYVFRKDLITEHTTELEQEIAGCSEPVSIHVRRGDYLHSDGSDIYADICTDEYYEGAISYILEKHPGATFYLFTNDHTWAEFFMNRHPGADIREVKGNSEYTGYLDLYLMSKCKHHILANSSFSWWGAWINESEDAITIAPDPWLNSEWCADIHTDRMIRISPSGERITTK